MKIYFVTSPCTQQHDQLLPNQSFDWIIPLNKIYVNFKNHWQWKGLEEMLEDTPFVRFWLFYNKNTYFISPKINLAKQSDYVLCN